MYTWNCALNSDVCCFRLVRKASFSLRKQMAKLEAAGIVKGQTAEEEGLQIDIDYYINAVSALVKLANSELKLMQGVIAEKHARKIFDMLLQAPLDLVMKDGEVSVSISSSSAAALSVVQFPCPAPVTVWCSYRIPQAEG